MTRFTSAKARQAIDRLRNRRREHHRQKAKSTTAKSIASSEQLIGAMASLEIKHRWRPSTVDPTKNVPLTLAQRKRWLPYSTEIPSPLRKTTSAEDLPDASESNKRIPMNKALKTWGSDTDLRMYVTSFDAHSQDIESHVRAAFKPRRPSDPQPPAGDKSDGPNTQDSQGADRSNDDAQALDDSMSTLSFNFDGSDSDCMDFDGEYGL